jgi:hypothetical protein
MIRLDPTRIGLLVVCLCALFVLPAVAVDTKPLVDKAEETVKKASDKIEQFNDKVKDLDTKETKRFFDEAPAMVGGVIMLVAAIPLFAGWLMLRVAYTLLLGAAAAVAANGLLGGMDPVPSNVVLYTGIGGAGLIGAVLGWYLSKATSAIVGAVVMAMLFMMPGAYFESQAVMLVLGPVGLIVGLVLGWKIGLYLDALNTAVLSAFFFAAGASIVARDFVDPNIVDWVALGALVVSALLGTWIQFKQVAKAQEVTKEKLVDKDYRHEKQK